MVMELAGQEQAAFDVGALHGLRSGLMIRSQKAEIERIEIRVCLQKN
jgi:hypothetical protein